MKKRYIILWSTVGVIVFAEIIIRLFFAENIRYNIQPPIYRKDSVMYYSYIPNTCFEIGKQKVYINKQGYIGSDFGVKSPDTLRIAIVGSCGVSGAVHKKAYCGFPPMLQQLFKDHNMPVRVLNCGIDGDNRMVQILQSVKYKVMDFNPDLLLFEYSLPFCSKPVIREVYKGCCLEYLVDCTEVDKWKEMIDRFEPYKKPMDILYHSYIVRGLAFSVKGEYFIGKLFKDKLYPYISIYEDNRLKDRRIYDESSLTQYTMEESILMVRDVKKELDESGIQFFMFQYGKDDSTIHVAKSNKLPLISLGLSFSEDDHFFHDAVHLNENGNRKIADRFYELMMKHGLIPEPYRNGHD